MTIVGGYSQPKPATPDEVEEALYFKDEAEEKLDKKFTIFTAISYQVQVVAGLNRRIRVLVDKGVVLLTVYESLDGKKTLTDVRMEHPCV